MLEFVIGRGLNIVFIAILARLLTPEDFGTFALLAIFVGVAQALVESGFGQALIHFQDTTDEDNSTVFWISLGIGTLFALGLYFTAPYIATFFETDVLVPLTHIMAITLWIGAFGIVQRALLVKRLAFRQITIINLSALLFASLMALILASLNFGVYTLAWQALFSATLTSALLWLVNGWRPTFQFRVRSAKRLFGFGGYMLASTLLEVVFSKSYTFLIGKVYGPIELGQFHRADSTSQMASGLVVAPLSKIIFPAFSQMRNDVVRIRGGLQDALRVSMLFNSAAMLTLAVVARPFVQTLLGPQWELAVQLLPILSLCALFMPLHVLNLQTLMALGRSDLFFVLEVIKKVVGFGILIFSTRYGVFGIAWGMVVTNVISFFINAWYSRVLLDFGPMRQVQHVFPSLAVGTVVAYAAYVSMTLSGLQGQILQLLVGISTAAAAFATVCGLAWLYGHDLTGLLSRSRDLPITPDTDSSA